MKILWGTSVLLCLLSTSSAIAATKTSLWGIHLGQNGTLTPNGRPIECPTYLKKESKYDRSEVYYAVDRPCFDLTRRGYGLGYQTQAVGPKIFGIGRHPTVTTIERGDIRDARLKWPKDKHPLLPDGRRLHLDLLWLNGAVEGLTVSTSGYRSQQAYLDMLTKKFGQPSTLTPQTVPGAKGGTVKGYKAVWITDELYVEHVSVTGRNTAPTLADYANSTGFDHGFLRIDTYTGRKVREAKINPRSPVEF